jgi:hypothetical protein
MENKKKVENQGLKVWETPVLKFEDFGSTLGGWHLFISEGLSGSVS